MKWNLPCVIFHAKGQNFIPLERLRDNISFKRVKVKIYNYKCKMLSKLKNPKLSIVIRNVPLEQLHMQDYSKLFSKYTEDDYIYFYYRTAWCETLKLDVTKIIYRNKHWIQHIQT